MRQIWSLAGDWPHKINNFDETWGKNAQTRILISTILSYSLHVLSDKAKHENDMMPPSAGDGFGR